MSIPAPRENPDLIGHEAAERELLAAWRSGRLPHGWLIHGPRGIGKATLAFRFARFVLSGGADPDSIRVGEDDPLFRRVASGGHSDLMTLERTYDSERKRLRSVIIVDDVRAAGRFLSLTAGEGEWRVVVVDAADEMNESAVNALLKMLEEPPVRTLMLLVSHAPGRLPATIRSRCRGLALERLPEDAVSGLLSRFVPELADDEAAALARLSEGSIGRAIGLAEAEGLALYRTLLALMQTLPGTDVVALHGFADRLAGRDAESAYRTATALLTWWIARMVGAGARGAPLSGGEVVPGEQNCAERLLGLAGVEQWMEVWEKVTRLIAQADGINLDRKQVVLGAFHAMERAARA